MTNFGTIDYWKNKWRELHFKYRPGDSLTRLNMKETAKKVMEKKQKEKNSG